MAILAASSPFVAGATRATRAAIGYRSSRPATETEPNRSARLARPFTFPADWTAATSPLTRLPAGRTSVPSTTTASVSVASIGSSTRLESEPTAESNRTASFVPSGSVNSRNVAIAGSAAGVSSTSCTSVI